jgi:hypothetical protein
VDTAWYYPEKVERWLTACLPHRPETMRSVRNLKLGNEREVWECEYKIDGLDTTAILSIFKSGSLESVNTNLLPGSAAQKCALAMMELPTLGIPTPRVWGYAMGEGEAAVLTERIVPVRWTPHVRTQAAAVLARIHTLEEHALSEPLRELARASDPREHRTTSGEGPGATVLALVHGDYFSANILPTADGLFIIDWETFGWGDPMWDLGFLIGADPGLENDEVEAVIAQYGAGATVERQRLMWHKRRWDEFWQQRHRRASHQHGNALGGSGP